MAPIPCLGMGIVFAGMATSAQAQTPLGWTGAVDGDFNNAANWNPAAVPGAGNSVTITSAGGGNQPTFSAGNGGIFSADIRDSGSLVIASGSSLSLRSVTLGSTAPATVGSLTVGSNAGLGVGQGMLIGSGSTFTVQGDVVLVPILGPLPTIVNFGNASFLAGSTLNGTFAAAGFTNEVGATLTNAGGLTTQVDNEGFLSNSGTISIVRQLQGLAENESGGLVSGLGQFGGTFDNKAGSSVGELVLKGGLFINQVGASVGPVNATQISDTGVLSNLGTIGNVVVSFTGQFGNAASGVAGVVSFAGLSSSTGSNLGTMAGLNFASSATFTNSGTITGLASIGAGTVTNSGSILGGVANGALGTLNLQATSIVSGGLANSGTVNARGQLNGAVANNAGQIVLTGATTGIGAFTQNAGASFSLGSFSTAIGSLAGFGTVDLGTATLSAGGDNSSTSFGGTLQNAGGFTKTGTGLMSLGGTSTYTGATAVNGGTLAVDGSIAASSGLTVNSGATVAGTGQLPSTVIGNGGTISPGNSVGTLTVNGNLGLNAGSTTVIEVQGAAIDRIVVTGPAALAGTLQLVPGGGNYLFHTPYTFLQAASVSGNFGNVTTQGAFGPAIVPVVRYTPSSAQLMLQAGALAPFVAGGTQNQRAVAGALDRAAAGGVNLGFLFPLYNMAAQDIPRGLDAISGQVGASVTALTADPASRFLSLMLDPWARRNDASPLARRELVDSAMAADFSGAAPPQRGARVWGTAFGGVGHTSADAVVGTFRQNGSLYGLAVGSDFQAGPDWIMGLALAGSSGWSGLADGFGRASAETFQAGAYSSARLGATRLSAAASYAFSDVTTGRTVAFAVPGEFNGHARAHGVSGRIEAGMRLGDNVPGIAVTPFAALQGQVVVVPGYAETLNGGPSPFALAFDRRTNVVARGEAGMHFDRAIDDRFALFSRIAYAGYVAREADFTASLAGLPGYSFAITGPRPGPHALIAGGGLDWRLNSSVSVALKAEGEVSDRHRSATGTARLSVRF